MKINFVYRIVFLTLESLHCFLTILVILKYDIDKWIKKSKISCKRRKEKEKGAQEKERETDKMKTTWSVILKRNTRESLCERAREVR